MEKRSDVESYAMLDFEASSLSRESWPVEIGLSWIEGVETKTWSSFIRPAPDWSVSDWSEQSAAVHRIAREQLYDAPSTYEVVKELFNKLAGRMLISDAPEFEARWMARMLTAAGCTTVPIIKDYHEVSHNLFSGLALDMLYESLERNSAPHRAGPDSARLANAWRKALKYKYSSRGHLGSDLLTPSDGT
jgi:DNA polymerase III subunit epsilon